ncbi:helix-turn-helix transcriptional regulator [Actinomadura madurae]|uniref:helix-turn-helix transcriptional regulator n=1 Tax=Actinomadura madurae TaxID=1993 RepID=UPI002026BD0B|nr:helix-turn-helix transcriptional regulator [Actinomadura madurae]MCP9955514.1 helix-turn-helix transcriptional regulator [Actinomadura madurae]MCP9972252.1 helix-turn-helix transcriptional regulator [Actinomadura madurae]MCP9984757.1 helix-turn-helix transcriptional regulator [Actinomadura madurae]MCQ0003692.1 helix-turn-helix transcriptional regulator [Actinomadura madurae]MCQ0020947.1 helix-turn-helix transcriptional regulator [Actinomadura madurae]
MPHRQELAAFLRSRRARIRPEDAGLPRGHRRRLTGLRREEVALLAGVSSTWYTYVEQGRLGVNPSRQVLDSLARVLHLDDDETRHLHQLADRAAVDAGLDADLSPAELARELVHLSEEIPYPVYAADVHCDLIAWNPATTGYYADFSRLPAERRNMMWWLIGNAEAKERLPDWEDDVRDVVARWRRVSASVADQERLRGQVAEYRSISPEFATWWDTHDVREHRTRARRFTHPQLGTVTLRLIVVDSAEMAPSSFVVYHAPVTA